MSYMSSMGRTMNKREIAIKLASSIIEKNDFFKAADTFQNNKALLASEAISMVEVLLIKLRSTDLPLD